MVIIAKNLVNKQREKLTAKRRKRFGSEDNYFCSPRQAQTVSQGNPHRKNCGGEITDSFEGWIAKMWQTRRS